MDAFIPTKLTRRMIVSKRASLYDMIGKIEPIKAKLKIDEREAVLTTSNWDDTVTPEIRNKWLRNFMMIEQLRGMKFTRARMPTTALDTNMRLITLVDAAKQLIMVVTFCGFRLQGGGWSNQQLIGRSALANGTIPRNELQGLNGGSNLAWIVKKALSDWVESSIIAGDSEIALDWTISDSRKLSCWHRNRVLQIRRGTEISNIFYVGTEDNVADVGTRADKVTLDDVGPESRYENGDPWMRLDMEQIIEQGILIPAEKLKPVTVEKEEDLKKGYMFEKEPEVLTRGHVADDAEEDDDHVRVTKMAERAAFSNYGRLLPTRWMFPVMVRITGYVLAFITKCRDKVNKRKGINKSWTGQLLQEASIRFSAFPTTLVEVGTDASRMTAWVFMDKQEPEVENCHLVDVFADGMDFHEDDDFYKVHATDPNMPSDKYLNAALLYYFRQASKEVVKFNSKQLVDKQAVMKDGVLLSKGRIIDGMNFLEIADLDTLHFVLENHDPSD